MTLNEVSRLMDLEQKGKRTALSPEERGTLERLREEIRQMARDVHFPERAIREAARKAYEGSRESVRRPIVARELPERFRFAGRRPGGRTR